jgi:SAM-dependent methyltransferase
MKLHGTAQDRLNFRIYHAADIHDSYRSDAPLDRAETMALLKYQPAFAGHEVLDLGIGTGRTSRFLAPLARTYVGTDYSPPMIDYVRSHLPGVTVHLVDMRDLSSFAADSFDFALASCNVIDAVSHDDRLQTLDQVRRVLRPHGLLMFSSHNRRFRDALSGPRLVRSRNPVTQLRYVQRYVHRLVNHARVRRLRRECTEYALLNDVGHEYAALHYYVDRDAQIAQLEHAGFQVCDVFDTTGGVLSDDGDDSGSPSLLYVAERGR